MQLARETFPSKFLSQQQTRDIVFENPNIYEEDEQLSQQYSSHDAYDSDDGQSYDLEDDANCQEVYSLETT